MENIVAKEIIIGYCSIAFVLFLIGIFIGKILKKDILHGGVILGFFNSLFLSVLWPITILVIFIGWGYDAVQGWKKL
ncbi:MAG: hypothetical protein J6Q22_10550 [Prevotella sp.]|nr:hypothetical protein [Prevotella sp.]